jgi:beta-1,2-mannobiose phosphorylase / 1,2-beta-oligomannan phosphorylase
MSTFKLKRIGDLMHPQAGTPYEAEGVLNPATVRGPDGHLYIFPRLVAKGNYSRIGIGRVFFDDKGDPRSVERIGIALEPTEEYELRPGGGGGCEDPRITFMEPYQHYTMNYVAFGPHGPRIALAVSEDLLHWKRIGLATFEPYDGIKFSGVDNKDSCLFPIAVPDAWGMPALALIHRPIFPGTSPEEKSALNTPDVQDINLESIWVSYRDIDLHTGLPYHRSHFTSHHRLAKPEAPWERLKIGVGCPPVLCRHGWLLIYHGVCKKRRTATRPSHLQYSAGLMILDKDDPTRILYRTSEPILKPELPSEEIGLVGNVVFPSGIDCRTDLGTPDRFDIYYGMADDRIGVARLDLPEHLPTS